MHDNCYNVSHLSNANRPGDLPLLTPSHALNVEIPTAYLIDRLNQYGDHHKRDVVDDFKLKSISQPSLSPLDLSQSAG